jgi:hypothetical protein
MKKILLTLSLVGVLAALSGCTDNIRSKSFGGSMNVALPTNQKLVTATWKESQLWYLYRPMHSNEVAETYTFQEKSSFGMVEGKVVFTESK